MKRSLSFLLTVSLILSMASCTGGSGTPSRKNPKLAHPADKAESVKPVQAADQVEEPKIPEYQVTGVRDPFQPFAGIRPEGSSITGEIGKGVDPLQKISIAQLYLVGVIMGKQKKALLQDTSGMGYIVNEGTLIGENNGVVTTITKDSVTVKQHFKDYMGRVSTREVVLGLRKEEGVK
jgi:Tfp pilus assembly protein PilP